MFDNCLEDVCDMSFKYNQDGQMVRLVVVVIVVTGDDRIRNSDEDRDLQLYRCSLFISKLRSDIEGIRGFLC